MVSFRGILKRPFRSPVVSRPLYRLLAGVGMHRLGLRVARLGKCLPEELEVRLPQDLFHFDTLRMGSCGGRDQVAVASAVDGWEAFEAPMPRVFCEFAQTSRVVFDVGANTGLFSFLSLARSPQVLVHAFEPHPDVAAVLEKNRTRNPELAERLLLHCVAVSARSGSQELVIPLSQHGNIETSATLNPAFLEREARPRELERRLQVETTTLADFVAQFPDAKPDLIKIDVEGLGHEVLAGSVEVLEKYRPIVFLEVLDVDRPNEMASIASQAGYVNVLFEQGELRARENVEFIPGGTNQMLVPAESAQRVAEVASRLGWKFVWLA